MRRSRPVFAPVVVMSITCPWSRAARIARSISRPASVSDWFLPGVGPPRPLCRQWVRVGPIADESPGDPPMGRGGLHGPRTAVDGPPEGAPGVDPVAGPKKPPTPAARVPHAAPFAHVLANALVG